MEKFSSILAEFKYRIRENYGDAFDLVEVTVSPKSFDTIAIELMEDSFSFMPSDFSNLNIVGVDISAGIKRVQK